MNIPDFYEIAHQEVTQWLSRTGADVTDEDKELLIEELAESFREMWATGSRSQRSTA